MELAKEQYKLLLKINRKKSIRTDNLTSEELISLPKLLELNYAIQVGIGSIGIDVEYYETQITEDGKMYIATRKMNNMKFIIPLIVSIVALVISVMALYKSSQPIQINIESATSTATIEQATEK